MITGLEEIKEWLNKIEVCVNGYAKMDGYTTDNFQMVSFEVKFVDKDDVDTIIKVFDYEMNEEIEVILPSKYYLLQDAQLGVYIYGAIKNR